MRNTIHILTTPFTGLGLNNGYRGDKWFENRIEIFKNYTLKSLLNQTNTNFIHWFSFRPEEAHNPLTGQLYFFLTTIGYPVVFTFGGLCFWDDKYPNDNLLERLNNTIPELQKGLKTHRLWKELGQVDYVYLTLVPSDDMYHKDAFAEIMQEPFRERGALIHWDGFCYDSIKKRLGTWQPWKDHLPPFYTLQFPADVFFDGQKHFDYYNGYRSHEDIERLFDCKILPDKEYCVLAHEFNISTGWKWRRYKQIFRHPFIRHRIYRPKKKRQILAGFGI